MLGVKARSRYRPRWWLILASVSCWIGCFDAEFDDGQVLCSTDGCPPGLTCGADGLCLRDPLPDNPNAKPANYGPRPPLGSGLQLPSVHVTALAAVADVTCATLSDGSVKCWGFHADGQLGYSPTEHVGKERSPSTMPAMDLGGAISLLALGWGHSCALAGGELRCWGSNDVGQLGYSQRDPVMSPSPARRVEVGMTVRAVAPGRYHTCAIGDESDVLCWGRCSLFDHDARVLRVGALGRDCRQVTTVGNGNSQFGDAEHPAELQPIELSSPVLKVAGGLESACVLTTVGVRCWGRNPDGQLGRGDAVHHWDAATSKVVDLGEPATDIVMGEEHACALLVSGRIRCWGRNGDGQLGQGNLTSIGRTESPVAAVALALGAAEDSVVKVVAGDHHNCAITSRGELYCWGRNASGQLGIGSQWTVGDDETVESFQPVDFGGVAVRDVAAGAEHTCALLDTGEVSCWGRYADGQLGYGSCPVPQTDESCDVLAPSGLAVPVFSVWR